MNEKDFVMNYLGPSPETLNRKFTHPLPRIDGIKKSAELIVQGRLDETFSTNIITKYASDMTGIRLVEVYKNTQHEISGIFVRLVGTMSLVKPGYPFLFIDAAISNISPLTAQREDITTRVAIHLPQAAPDQRKKFFNCLSAGAKEEGTPYRELHPETLPDFWGPIWLGESKRFNFDIIRQLRDLAWASYKSMIEGAKENPSFDYTPMQQHIIFKNSAAEHLLFKKMGLAVPVEAQAAFFSMLVLGLNT